MSAEPQVLRTVRRIARRPDAFMVPQPVARQPGRFIVDGTWGTISPIQIADGVRTVGELEVIAHIEAGLPVVDTRAPHFVAAGTIPSARVVPHDETIRRLDEFDRANTTVLFCNGPQCAATPDTIRTLLNAGHPAERILYYRGGIHDWVTLGLPLVIDPGHRRSRSSSPTRVARSPADARSPRTRASRSSAGSRTSSS